MLCSGEAGRRLVALFRSSLPTLKFVPRESSPLELKNYKVTNITGTRSPRTSFLCSK